MFKKVGTKRKSQVDILNWIRYLYGNTGPPRPPPDINKEEMTLSRKSRSRLAQLRSGFILSSYRNICDPEIENTCPNCQRSSHDTQHLFNCEKNPTHLTTLDLWKKPIQAANFFIPGRRLTWTTPGKTVTRRLTTTTTRRRHETVNTHVFLPELCTFLNTTKIRIFFHIIQHTH